jgi:O-antigen/teichoic acid export membrane protein
VSRRLGAAAAINFTSQISASVVPAVLMVITFPIMKAALSAQSFAGFALLFTAISFVSVADAGLGRSVTYFAARYLHDGRDVEAMGALWAALFIGLLMSIAGVLVVVLVQAFSATDHAAAARIDYSAVVRLLWFLPVFVCGSLLRGFLEAEQRFLAVNSVQLLYSAAIGVAPLILLRFTTGLEVYPLVFGLLRMAMVVACLMLIRSSQKRLLLPVSTVVAKLGEVLRYAKWLFVSNVIGIAIIYADRVIVAAKLPTELISAYLVPMDLVLRGQIFFGALSTVLFPLLVRAAARKSDSLASGAAAAQLVVFGAALTFAALICSVVPTLLSVWMGRAFSVDATLTFRIALMGLAAIGCASLAMTVLNAQGRTAQPAFLHLIELPLYAAALWAAARTHQLGFIVAAWLARVSFDMAGTQLLMLRSAAKGKVRWLQQQGVFCGTLVGYFALMTWGSGPTALSSLPFVLLGIGMLTLGVTQVRRLVLASGVAPAEAK